jgi:hypothetical protein
MRLRAGGLEPAGWRVLVADGVCRVQTPGSGGLKCCGNAGHAEECQQARRDEHDRPAYRPRSDEPDADNAKPEAEQRKSDQAGRHEARLSRQTTAHRLRLTS